MKNLHSNSIYNEVLCTLILQKKRNWAKSWAYEAAQYGNRGCGIFKGGIQN